MRLRYILLLCLILISHPVSAGDDGVAGLPEQCLDGCNSRYGTVLGHSPGGIDAYSNCQPGCVIFDPAEYEGTYTGIKWQCVEFARRWLLIQRGAVYGDVDFASDIWTDIQFLTDVKNHEKIPLESYVNGSASAPKIGDLLIYARAFHGTGHVAVVTDTDHAKGIVEVGEQNFNNEPWQDDHAREIPWLKSGDRYWLLDSYLLGWKHIKAQ